MVMSHFQRVKSRSKKQTSACQTHKMIEAYSVDCFCGHCNTVFEATGCYKQSCSCQETCPLLIGPIKTARRWKEKKRERERERERELEESRNNLSKKKLINPRSQTLVIGRKSSRQIFMLSCIIRILTLNNACQRKRVFLENSNMWHLFNYIQSNLKVAENLQENVAIFAPNSEKIHVGGDDAGPFIIQYAIKEDLLAHNRRTHFSSCFLRAGITVTPLLLFCLDFELICNFFITICDICSIIFNPTLK